VTVIYATGEGTATAGADYTTTSGVVSFQPLATSETLTILVTGDLLGEPDETFLVSLSDPSNGALGDAQGLVTILDDDAGASLSVSDASVTEGDTGVAKAVFMVALSRPATVKVKVHYATHHVTTTNQDLGPTSGQLVFQPGETAKAVFVPVKGDVLDEEDETFVVLLSDAEGVPIGDGEGAGTILDDDPLPSLRVSDAKTTEGNKGTKNAIFVVSLSEKSGRPVTVAYSTADGTAVAGSDYVATSGILTFTPGETSKSIVVVVRGDRVKEGRETFYLNLSDPSNATVAGAQGVGTIRDCD
jgi:hypothetical protein